MTQITEAMPVNVLGFQTHRDDFAIDLDRETLCARIAAMRDTELTDDAFKRAHGLSDNRDWQLAEARKALRDDADWERSLIRVAYRPFDERWGYFSEIAMDYPRRELIEHVAGKENTCIGVGRAGNAVSEDIWSLQICSIGPMDANIFRRGGVNVFPLWLYPSTTLCDLLDNAALERRANFAPNFLAAAAARIEETPQPETLFAFIYAVLYAPSYRMRYAEFLKRDFPRVPLPCDAEQFSTLAALGQELIELHTLQRALPAITRYPATGSNRVDRVRWAPAADATGRVYINSEQYFDGVPAAVWDTHIGGYRVAEKWLKDRKGRILSYDDLTHYQQVIAALARTLEIQSGIDAAIAQTGVEMG